MTRQEMIAEMAKYGCIDEGELDTWTDEDVAEFYIECDEHGYLTEEE